MSVQVPSGGTPPPPSRAEALEATWREYYRHASEAPRNPGRATFCTTIWRARWRG